MEVHSASDFRNLLADGRLARFGEALDDDTRKNSDVLGYSLNTIGVAARLKKEALLLISIS